jgi:hypothetical protein
VKYRAVANGNLYDESEVPESLRGSVFVPVEEDAGTAVGPPPAAAAPARESALTTPEAPLLTTAHTDPPAQRRRKRA